MATVDVMNWENKKVGSVELNPEVFEKPVRKDLLHTIVRWQLAARRQGTHKAKSRGEVSGGGAKPFKQKGTGNARQGSSRSPLLEGGGVHFAPRPRDYSFDVPKKVRMAGLKSALSHLVSEGRLIVVDSMASAEGKTKELASRLKNLGIEKAVLVSSENDENFGRAARNIPKVVCTNVAGINVYDLLKYDKAVVTEQSLRDIETRCGVRN